MRILIKMAAVLMLAGCTTEMPTGSYDSLQTFRDSLAFGVFSELAQYDGPARRPVVIVPGLLGSRLRNLDTGKVAWGEFSPRGFDDAFFRGLAFPMQNGRMLAAMRDRNVADGMLLAAEIRILGMSFESAGYAGLVDILKSAGYVTESDAMVAGHGHPTLFLFSYDWRRNPAENAVELAKFIDSKRDMLLDAYHKEYGPGDYDIRFDLIAHSMGGLVSRYYMMYGTEQPDTDGTPPPLTWAGARNLARVAIVATPNAGYLDTLLEMNGGLRLSEAAPLIPGAVLATMPSYYAMLPWSAAGGEVRNLHGDRLDMFDPAVWERYGWGLAGPAAAPTLATLLPDVADPQARREIALDHQKKCLAAASALRTALTVEADPPPWLQVTMFAGDAVPTDSVAEASLAGGLRRVEFDAGDGKVLCSSVRADRFVDGPRGRRYDPEVRWDAMVYLPASHMGITNSSTFASNLLSFLLLDPDDEDNPPPTARRRRVNR
ncbi:MAG: esterase/lipase family protein [Victivallaceae bacterium]|nr:hypothetical protein [Victivallaceae bacterium]